MAAEQEQIIYLSPEHIKADDNSRYGIKAKRREDLQASIIEVGGVMVPVEVEELDPSEGQYTHRLTSGFYRHAAVDHLNKTMQAGMELPCIVRNLGDAQTRLKHQLLENMSRENQSPMDQAVAIKKLLDSGVSRLDVRKMFARPAGKKGTEIFPASNSWVNITMGLLDLPKSIQTKIHEGHIGMAAAYELGKVSPEKRAAVLERAEADRLGQIEKEASDERKYLDQESKAAAAEAKAAEVDAGITETKAQIEAATVMVRARIKDVAEMKKTPILEMSKDDQDAHMKKLTVAEADVKAASKIKKAAENELATLLEKSKKAAETVEAAKERLATARKANGAKKPKAVGPGDVKAAAKAEGETIGVIKLSASDMRQAIADLQKESMAGDKVRAIGRALESCFNSEMTVRELVETLAELVDETVPVPAPKVKRVAPVKGKALAAK